MQRNRSDRATAHHGREGKARKSGKGQTKHSPGVIVVGSTTTALLVEALALADMLRCTALPIDFPSHRAKVLRAATWAEAMGKVAEHAPCVVVASGEPRLPQPPTDAAGGEPYVIDAELLLAQSLAPATPRIPQGTERAMAFGRRRVRRWLDALHAAATTTPTQLATRETK